MALLSLVGVDLRFGDIVALDDVSLEVEEGQIAGLIGPNGAGKTTAFNVITRLYRPDKGQVVFDGIRTGSDVLKALALGADAVLLGRPYAYGLAVGGDEGVEVVLRQFADETDVTLALIGAENARDLDSTWIAAS